MTGDPHGVEVDPVVVLGFDDRRSGGAYPVQDAYGTVIAEIVPGWFTSKFQATDPSGAVICSGRARFLSGWVAVDASGGTLAELRNAFLGGSRVWLRGGALQARLRGRAFSRNWELTADDGQVLLISEPHRAGWLFAPDAWIVGTNGVLTLPEVIAVVELHRLDVKRQRNSSSDGA